MMDASDLALDAMQDQADQAWRGMAHVTAVYYRALLQAGFSDDHAFDLTAQAADTLLMRTLFGSEGHG